MLGIAQTKGALEFYTHDLRNWTHDLHRSVDDSPYGGGAGMVMKVDVLVAAIEAVAALDERSCRVVFLTPVGTTFSQDCARAYAAIERLLLVCGRYEGFDERAFDWADECLSLGDFVLTGGEVPALAVIDAVVRLIPGVLGSATSTQEESFSLTTGAASGSRDSFAVAASLASSEKPGAPTDLEVLQASRTPRLLEYPHYTRPAVFRGRSVPEVLLSGDHARIAAWRAEQALERTRRLRPDLLSATMDELNR
jgi:tRNA (guanine37-N1)-methyltransferase